MYDITVPESQSLVVVLSLVSACIAIGEVEEYVVTSYVRVVCALRTSADYLDISKKPPLYSQKGFWFQFLCLADLIS